MLSLYEFDLVFEFILLLIVMWVWSKHKYNPKICVLDRPNDKTTVHFENWQPEPLVPTTDDEKDDNEFLSSDDGETTNINSLHTNGKRQKNMIVLDDCDVFNFSNDSSVENIVLETVKNYGVGTCGPRGFLGSNDVHRKLEQKIAQFLGTQDSIVYSYGYATLASVIPAYVKRDDIAFVCTNLCSSGTTGLKVSGCENVYWYGPGDMASLERQIQLSEISSKLNPNSKKSPPRKFFIVEGINQYDGTLVDLPHILRLKREHKIRIILDESLSLGVMGRSGRGITDHFNVPTSDIDILTCSMETTLASYGGFCAGSHYVIDHQRLSSLAYCFSASLPTFQAQVAIHAIDNIESNLDKLTHLRRISYLLTKELQSRNLKMWQILGVASDDHFAPIIIRLSTYARILAYYKHLTYWKLVVAECLSSGISISLIEGCKSHPSGCPILPGVKITPKVSNIMEECITIADVLRDVHHRTMEKIGVTFI